MLIKTSGAVDSTRCIIEHVSNVLEHLEDDHFECSGVFYSISVCMPCNVGCLYACTHFRLGKLDTGGNQDEMRSVGYMLSMARATKTVSRMYAASL